MTIFFEKFLFSSSFWEKLFIYFFDKTINDFVISNATSFLSKYVEYPPLVGYK